MELSPKPKKLLFMFSDASPQDDQIAGEGAFIRTGSTLMLLLLRTP